MRRIFSIIALTILVATTAIARVNNALTPYWQAVENNEHPSKALTRMNIIRYKLFQLDELKLTTVLTGLSTDLAKAEIIRLPMPDGSMRDFRVWSAPMMPDQLAAKYPEIRTFSAEAVGNKTITAKLDITDFGFHAMIIAPGTTSFIDPTDAHDGSYLVHAQKDEIPAKLSGCYNTQPINSIVGSDISEHAESNRKELRSADRYVSGWKTTSYRIAISADSMYCNAATAIVNPTKAQALSAITTTLNRVNGILNRELSIQLNFCRNEDTLLYGCAGFTNGPDPFAAINANAALCLDSNQASVTRRIADAFFDLGQVFTTGTGGLSTIGVACNNTDKAQSCAGVASPVGDGFNIDYVAHEIGHLLGAQHTFNNNIDGTCASSAVSYCAYEPGSGATIMDFAGRCNPDDLQPHDDGYFNPAAIEQILNTVTTTEAFCAVVTTNGNHAPTLAPFTTTYTIPYKTPFELIAPAVTDSAADTANLYQWLQWNLGNFGARLSQTFVTGPIFRSFSPVNSQTRVFPQIDSVLHGNLSNVGVEDAQGEKAPDTARNITFRLAARGILSGYGSFLFADDSIVVTAWQTGAAAAYQGFTVTSQTTPVTYAGGSVQTITWNVVGTNAAPVNCDSVDIYLAVDGGYTWPYYIGRYPNTGTATVTIPTLGGTTPTCRIKVKGANNIFFNVNAANITVTEAATGPAITGALTACVGGTTTLGNPIPGGNWSSTNVGVATISNAGIVTGNTIGTTVISYITTSDTATAIVTINTAPAAPTVVLASPLPCAGATTGTWVANAAGATSCAWIVSGSGWYGSSVTNSIVVTLGIDTGTLICTAINACGSATDTTLVNTSSLPYFPTVTLSGPVPCLGTTTAVYDGVSSGATSYIWSVFGTGWSGSSTTATLNVNIGTGTGMIICTGVNACGSSNPDTVYLSEVTLTPAPTGITPLTNVCEDAVAMFEATPIPEAATYTWTVTGSGWSGTSSTNILIVNIGTGSGTISVAGVNACGTGASFALAGINPFVPPAASFSLASHTEIVYVNDVVTYDGSPSALGYYSWNFDGGIAIPGTGVGPHLVHWTTPGLKTITLNVTDTGCTSLVYSDTVLVEYPLSISTEASNSDILLTPNPNNGIFKVLCSKPVATNSVLHLYDMAGKLVREYPLVIGSATIDATDLPNGVYMITLLFGNTSVNKKLVICR